jgi:hypothetical protein
VCPPAAGGELFDRIIAKGFYSEKDAAEVTREVLQVTELSLSLSLSLSLALSLGLSLSLLALALPPPPPRPLSPSIRPSSSLLLHSEEKFRCIYFRMEYYYMYVRASSDYVGRELESKTRT